MTPIPRSSKQNTIIIIIIVIDIIVILTTHHHHCHHCHHHHHTSSAHASALLAYLPHLPVHVLTSTHASAHTTIYLNRVGIAHMPAPILLPPASRQSNIPSRYIPYTPIYTDIGLYSRVRYVGRYAVAAILDCFAPARPMTRRLRRRISAARLLDSTDRAWELHSCFVGQARAVLRPHLSQHRHNVDYLPACLPTYLPICKPRL
ncbi:hypothetical protein F5B22DRAFT_543153 [Xylaria bambusicola]|uniref:uncharacterized protein n=1 Tax=Xylaria bambusicola TaxID=326684 RepID=UPI002008C2D2|nr:uncharacterized protein F5B22DRAFT_543153 [Xylaria bambusicola]KAI0521575.1 hypothetical protein F5B22DRAFT_543153 [Xylaria bambusicola]